MLPLVINESLYIMFVYTFYCIVESTLIPAFIIKSVLKKNKDKQSGMYSDKYLVLIKYTDQLLLCYQGFLTHTLSPVSSLHSATVTVHMLQTAGVYVHTGFHCSLSDT